MLRQTFVGLAATWFIATTPAFAAGPARSAEDSRLVWTASQVVLVSREVAPNVFAVFPDDAEAKNKAGIPVATSGGFIVGNDGVLVVDSMLNRRLANQLLALIRAKTAKPIAYVVNTSYHGDHSYGNQFMPKGARVIQHVETQKYIQARFKDDVAFMSKYFGTNQGLAELRPQRADILVPHGGTLELDLGGKRVRILHLGFAQTVGDLFVWLPNDKVLFTGNPIIATPPALPWLLDGRLEDSLQTLTRVRRLIPDDAVVVPGHGAPVDPKTVDFNIAYLGRLQREVRDAVDRGLDEKATVRAVAMKEYEGYRIFPWVHAQINVPNAYQEMKRANGAPAEARPGLIESRFTEVNGLRMHYLAAGSTGDPVILLHGYAQTSHMWRPLMNELGKTRRVIAPDLRGFGDTTKAESGYDKKTMAQDVRALVRKLGIGKAAIAGHDIGLMVAYAYAAQYPSEVERIALMDAFIPGVGDTTNLFLLRDLWHFHFYGPVPLALVEGRERVYFEHFWNDFAADGTKSVSESDRRFYAAKYAQPGAMKAGMEVFRNFDKDAIENREFSKTKLTMPMLVLGGEKSGGDFLISQARLVASNVEGVIIKGSGHWLIDEAPGQVIPRLMEFFK